LQTGVRTALELAKDRVAGAIDNIRNFWTL
jgi:hypothetical protein